MKQTFDAGTAQRIQINDVADELQVRGWDQPTIEVSSSGQIDLLQPQDNTLVINGCHENLTVMVPYASIISASGLHDSASIEHVQQVDIYDVGDDLTVRAIARLAVDNVGNDCHVTNSEQADIAIRNIGNDLSIVGANQVTIENIGNDAHIQAAHGNISIQVIGNDLILTDIGGEIRFNSVGSDAILKNIHGQVNAGNIGADLHLQADFAPESVSHLNVGGDATIILPTDPNLTIQAFVGGDITGRAIVSSQIGNRATLTYGEGTAHLELMVGGDLSLRSDKGPKSSSNSNAWWNDFGREMADFGREMSNLGRDLGADIASSVAEAASSMNINAASASTQQKYRDKADQMRQKTEEKIRRTQDKNIRLNIRLHDREWRMDPDRINRIVEEAQQAAADGVHGAMEAVEQALRNINLTRPVPPTPPTPPTYPPTADPTDIYAQPVNERAQPEVPAAPADTQSAAINIEQEREAILRMIAEGRITPEEGDMLLEALGN